ncbi:hypothetical protein BDQ12DRAFT_730351 [Crucibulum laeve]|uniref:Uncharacterized protein n=1 Tax=Crucibulum laeve TaxID=68775 RepID=A0A5C3MH82_9AGAR|nr:hypothetical protein BDQ12DRAFT_730351 [Crucibulum laeve]
MDPISISSAIVTVVDIGRKIKNSIDKVTQNRQRLRELTGDVVQTLSDLENLSKRHESVLEGVSELEESLRRVQTEISYVHTRCQKMMPRSSTNQLSVVKAKVKAWHMRDDIESDIIRLKERVQSCYAQFTAFTAARVEHTSIRIEHTLLIQGTESQSNLRRLEILMTRMLLDTQFGQQIIQQVGQSVTTDFGEYSIETQYLRLQISRVADTLHNITAVQSVIAEEPSSRHVVPFEPCYKVELPHESVVTDLLLISRDLHDRPHEVLLQDQAMDLQDVAIQLNEYTMYKEAILLQKWVVRLYRNLVPGNPKVFLPRLGHSFKNLAIYLQNARLEDEALQASESSVSAFRMIVDAYPELDCRALLAFGLRTHGNSLHSAGRLAEAVSLAEESVNIYRELVQEIATADPIIDLTADDTKCTTVYAGARACLCKCQLLMNAVRYREAYEAIKECLDMLSLLPEETFDKFPQWGTPQSAFDLVFRSLVSIYETEEASLSLVEDVITVYRKLSQAHPTKFSSYFLRSLYGYAYLCSIGDATGVLVLKSDQMNMYRSIVQPDSWSSVYAQSKPTSFDACVRQLQATDGGKQTMRAAVYMYFTMKDEFSFSTQLLEGMQFLIATILANQAVDGIVEARRAAEIAYTISNDFPDLLSRLLLGLEETMTIVQEKQTKASIVSFAKDVTEHCRTCAVERDLAKALNIYGQIVLRSGNMQDALAIFDQSVELYRPAMVDAPNVIVEFLHGRNDSAATLLDLSHFKQALSIYESILSEILSNQYQWSQKSLFTSVTHQISICLLQLQQPQAALQFSTEAVSVWRNHLSERWQAPDIRLCTLLERTANLLLMVDQNDEALALSEEAVTVFPFPEETSVDLAFTLAVHSRCLAVAGNNEKAAETAEKALAMIQEIKLPLLKNALHFATLALSLVQEASASQTIACAKYAVTVIRQITSGSFNDIIAVVRLLDAVATKFFSMNMWTEAIELWEDVISAENSYVSQSPQLSTILEQLSQRLREAKQSKARDMLSNETFDSLPPIEFSKDSDVDDNLLRTQVDHMVQLLLESKAAVEFPVSTISGEVEQVIEEWENRINDQSLDDSTLIAPSTVRSSETMVADPAEASEKLKSPEIPVSTISGVVEQVIEEWENRINDQSLDDSTLIAPSTVGSSETIVANLAETSEKLKSLEIRLLTDNTSMHSAPISPSLPATSKQLAHKNEDPWHAIKHNLSLLANIIIVLWTLAVMWNSFRGSGSIFVQLDALAIATGFRR